MAETVKVVARFRPVSEWQDKTRSGDGVDDFKLDFLDEKSVKLTSPSNGIPLDSKPFNFDYVFKPDSSQDDVFEQVGIPILKDILTGYNGCIFAYGQTGSGKSHTMFGPRGSNVEFDDHNNPNPTYAIRGLIPRIIEGLFIQLSNLENVTEVNVECSYLEIYREQVRDLLNPKMIGLKIRENPDGDVFVQDLTSEYVSDTQEMLNIIREGEKNRTVAATAMNEVSSRSHSVLIMIVTQKCTDGSVKRAKLNLADLAGSERINTTGATGTTLEEAKMINKSLSAQGNCISALTEKGRSHVPYRDSTLSFLLKDSLGGKAKMCLVVALSSAAYNTLETRSSLMFGNRCKQIKVHAKINRQRSVAELELIINSMKKDQDNQTKYIVLLKALLTEMYFRCFGMDEEKVKMLLAVATLASNVSGSDSVHESAKKAITCALQILLDQIKTDGGSVSALTIPVIQQTKLPSPREALAHNIPETILEDEKAAPVSPAATPIELQQVPTSPIPTNMSVPRVSVAQLEAIKLDDMNEDIGWGDGSDDDEDREGMWGGQSSSEDEESVIGSTITMPDMMDSRDDNSMLVNELKSANEEKTELLGQRDMRIMMLEADSRNYQQDIRHLKEKLADLQKKEQHRLEDQLSMLKNSYQNSNDNINDVHVDISDAVKGDIEKLDVLTLRTKLGKAVAQESAQRSANTEQEQRIEQMKQTWSSYLDIVMDTQALQQAVAKGPKVVKPVRAARRSYVSGSITPSRTPVVTPLVGSPMPELQRRPSVKLPSLSELADLRIVTPTAGSIDHSLSNVQGREQSSLLEE